MGLTVIPDREISASESELIHADGSVTFVADQSLGGNSLTNVADPVDAQDAATKAYVDAAVDGLGTGDVLGPVSSTDRAIATWNGADGDTLRDNPDWTISANGKLKAKSSYSPMISPSGGATVNLDLNSDNVFLVPLTANTTLTVTNATVGQRFMVRTKQDATGSRTLGFFDGIRWPSGAVPAPTSTASKADWWGFICTHLDGYGDPQFDGFVLGKGY